jgi:hypothetical protein
MFSAVFALKHKRRIKSLDTDTFPVVSICGGTLANNHHWPSVSVRRGAQLSIRR